MTPAARVQAAIELLDSILVAAREGGAAADTLIARYFAERRYAGSKDRRAVRELVYAAIRRAGEPPVSGRAALLGLAADTPELLEQFDGSIHGPTPIVAGEPVAAAGIAPRWLVERLAASSVPEDEHAALVDRAPLDVRVNRLRTNRDAAFAELSDAEVIPGLPEGLRLPTGTNVEALPLWRDGGIEVQDAGSQWVTLAAEARSGMQVVDLCAGAGGKSLALAAAMGDAGALLACDIDRARLSRLAPRAARAGVSIVETRLLNPGHELSALENWRDRADLVFVDAPCSGTGTWRRNPEARWRLSSDRLARLAATQSHVLDIAASLVAPGGALVYVVCSLLDEEGAGQAERFLSERRGWSAEPLPVAAGIERGAGRRLTPHHDATDGFFVARLRRA